MSTRRKVASYGQHLRKWRDACGLTQEQAADRLGVSQKRVSDRELYGMQRDPAVFKKYDQVYGLKPGTAQKFHEQEEAAFVEAEERLRRQFERERRRS